MHWSPPKVLYVGGHMDTDVANFWKKCTLLLCGCFMLYFDCIKLYFSNKFILDNLLANPWIISNEEGDMHGLMFWNKFKLHGKTMSGLKTEEKKYQWKNFSNKDVPTYVFLKAYNNISERFSSWKLWDQQRFVLINVDAHHSNWEGSPR